MSSLRGDERRAWHVGAYPQYDAYIAPSLRTREPLTADLRDADGVAYLDEQRRSAVDDAILNAESILVGMLLPIGDTLLATPALAALRRRFPKARITVVASRSNAGILKDNPTFDQLVVLDEVGPDHKWIRFVRRLSQLRQEGFDLTINLSPISAIVNMMAGIYARRLHVRMPAFWWLIGGHSERYRARHAVDHYLHAIAPILSEPVYEEARQPRVYLTAKDRSSARRHLREWKLSPADLIVTMHVGGEGFNGRKQWAPDRFAEVANRLVERFDARVILVGGAADLEMCEAVAERAPRNVVVAAGQTSLKETAALIELSAVFVGNDSCPLHIAAAVHTPAVGIFGPSNYEQFHPIGKQSYRSRIVHSDLPCSPCFNFIGNDAPWVPNTCYTRACLKAISVDQVLDAAIELLQDKRER